MLVEESVDVENITRRGHSLNELHKTLSEGSTARRFDYTIFSFMRIVTGCEFKKASLLNQFLYIFHQHVHTVLWPVVNKIIEPPFKHPRASVRMYCRQFLLSATKNVHQKNDQYNERAGAHKNVNVRLKARRSARV